jgi:hypothetical protein
LDTVTGPPDRRKLARKVGEAANWQQLEAVSDAVLGPSGFSEFARFHRGQLLTKAPGAATADIVRIALAHPTGMKQRVELAPDAASYAGGPGGHRGGRRRGASFLLQNGQFIGVMC